MGAFCNEIIAGIKSAKSETELINVIGNSMSQLKKERKSYNEATYFMIMVASLRATDSEGLSAGARRNARLAISIFRLFQKESRERSFLNQSLDRLNSR